MWKTRETPERCGRLEKCQRDVEDKRRTREMWKTRDREMWKTREVPKRCGRLEKYHGDVED
jgi:hypothetical protein